MKPAMESSPKIDWFNAGPDQIKDEIARTRAHMDEHLSQLGRKFQPGAKLKKLAIPAAALVLASAGFLIYQGIRKGNKAKSAKGHATARIKALRFKSAGMWDQFRAVRLALSLARQGKPGIFIVEPPG